MFSRVKRRAVTVAKMVDEDTEPEYSDFDSPLSASVNQSCKSKTPKDQRSIDRLYATSASHRQHSPESERSSLLGNRDVFRNYNSTTFMENPDSSVEAASSQPLKALSRKVSRVFQPKMYDYDSNKDSLAAVGSGERVWYSLPPSRFKLRIGDYRTIDWVHDSVKDQFRKKKLRSMTGLRGFIVNVLDSSEGWVLVGIIGTYSCHELTINVKGVVTALIAYCIDVWESVLFDWKVGCCTSTTDFVLTELIKTTGHWIKSSAVGISKVRIFIAGLN